MVEYILLVALLAVASIPIIKVLGDVFRTNLLESADALVGGGNYSGRGSAIVGGSSGKVSRSMKNFNKGGGGGANNEADD